MTMHDTVTCPSCRVRLRLPVEPPTAGMTCPRCRVQVPYPEIALATLPAPPAKPPAGDAPGSPLPRPEPPPAAPAPCPACGKLTEPGWVVCPYCEEPLRRPLPRSAGFGPHNAHQDSRALKIGLGLLCVLGCVGAFWFFAVALADRQPDAIVAGILVLLLLSLVSTAITFWRTRDKPSERSLGRIVLGTFTLVGAGITAGCADAGPDLLRLSRFPGGRGTVLRGANPSRSGTFSTNLCRDRSLHGKSCR